MTPTVAQLAPLMYRPRWSGLALSGSVRSYREANKRSGAEECNGKLWLASGGRYRADLMDEDGDRTLDICDGQSVWVVEDEEAYRVDAADAVVPFTRLLNPAWVLSAYRLEITGPVTHAGRAGYAVTGYQREAGRARKAGLPGEQINAVIDGELGILLGYERTGPGITAESAEFTDLDVNSLASADLAIFCLPDGVRSAAEDAAPAAVNSGELERSDGPTEPISDDVVSRLYGAALRQRRFSAILSERADKEAVAATMRSARSGEHRTTRQLMHFAADLVKDVDMTTRLQMALPGRYRIDALSGTSREPACIVCDDDYLWQVYPDRIYRWPATPPPAGLAPLLDPAWLLDGYRLSHRGQASVAGRAGLRILAVPDNTAGVVGHGLMSRISFPADEIDIVVDIELGVALRLAWSWQGQILFTAELSDVTDQLQPDAFNFEPPPGVPVHTTANPLHALTARDAVGTAAKVGKFAADIWKLKRNTRARP